MRRRSTWVEGGRAGRDRNDPLSGAAARRRGRRRRVVLVGAALVPALALLAAASPAEAGTPASQSEFGVVLSCLHAWMDDAGGAFVKGGQCDAAQQILAGRVQRAADDPSEVPAPDPSGRRAATPSAGPVPEATATATPAASAPSAAPASPPPAVPSAAPADTPSATPSAVPPAPSSTPSAGPAPEATAPPAAPTDAPTASPSAAPSIAPVGPAGDGRPQFDSGPRSGPVTCRGQTGVVIQDLTFDDIRGDVPAITIDGCHDVLITRNDFARDAEPIYVKDSTDVRIVDNRYRDIAGPHERNGSHRGNFTQWEDSFGGVIRGNTGVGGDTEDVISIYRSGGTSAADPLVIEDNVFRGTTWSSASGSGIMLGDGGGSHVVVRRNTLVDVGQVGIGIAGGSDIRVVDNLVSGSQRALSNVGIYAWGQGSPCADVTIARNRVDFVKEDGTRSPIWDGGNCGPIDGWGTNLTGPIALGDVLPDL